MRVSSQAALKFKAAKYPEEERIVHKKYKARRQRGLPVDGEWLQSQMRLQVKDKDPNFKASWKWLSMFCERKGVSLQRKTHRKSRSIKERLPKIRRFHWYAVYQMADEDP